MKKLVATVFSVVLVFAFSVSAFASFNIIIDDAAGLFTEDEIENINSAAFEFASLNDYSVAVVTTEDATGKSAKEYADDYYDELMFSKGWSENGMCFLIDMDNREIYVSCAGLCIDEYSDYQLDSILDKGYDCVVNGEYFKCIVSMIEEAGNFVSDDYNPDEFVETGDWNVIVGGYHEDEYGDFYEPAQKTFSFSHVFIYVIIGLAIGGITVFCVKNSYKNTGKGDEFNANDITLELTASNDNIISKNVITTKIPRNNNHHRPGGGGGGVSVHRSSGGVRHSGAGRKF